MWRPPLSKDDRRLGKGLAALLGENVAKESEDADLELSRIRPNPFQPRAQFDGDALADLASSIQANGLLQPIVVRPVGEVFQIVAGERRFRAVETLGWDRVSVVTRSLTDEQMLVVALVENLQRENLSPLEEAHGYQQLIEVFGLTQEEVGRHVGRDRSTVSNALRLLSLPERVRELLAEGRISAGHARAVLGLEEASVQVDLAERAAKEGWSVRETERRVRSGKPSRATRPPAPRQPAAARDPMVRRAELVLERGLGTQVRIHTSRDGGGDLVVHFHDGEDLLRLVEMMAGERVASELRG